MSKSSRARKASRNTSPRATQSGPLTPVADEIEMYRLILDSIYNGVLVTDAEGYITHFNKPYGRFLGVNPDEQIGKHVTDVIENTRMHVVARTGKAEINKSHRIKGQNMVVQRIPIKKDGRVIAVYGQVMFKDVRDVSQLAHELSMLESKVELYEQELLSLRSTRYTIESIIGVGQAITRLKEEALRAGKTHLPVLITGESGTGKELFAQAIHHASARRVHPFVRINCAAIPKDLVESELFGYEKGAFTGARSHGKPGKFELGHKGTVFLDEIGDLPMDVQPKLLRVLEEKEFERIGGTSLIRADFRLIAASNQNLEQMVEDGRFRKDLYYRLNVIPLRIPPLRARPEDIAPLVDSLVTSISRDLSLATLKVDSEAMEILENHQWPGNVRELSNILERVVFSVEGDTICAGDLPVHLQPKQDAEFQSEGSRLRDVAASAEKTAIEKALGAARGNKARAAQILGIHRTQLYKKMKKHEITL